MAMAIMVLILEVFLVWSYRDSFNGALNPRAKPTALLGTDSFSCKVVPRIGSKLIAVS